MTTNKLMLVALVVSGLFAISNSDAEAQCPAVGADTGCGIVITVTDSGATAVATGQGPYDSVEDTLIGVINNSKVPISSIVLSSNLPIFGFDADGIDTFGVAGNASDSTGYGGPNAFFTNISSDQTSGEVDFINKIPANGGTDFFSLEDAIDAATACTDIINNSIMSQSSGKNICATFTPNQSETLTQAAQLCGFTNFDWVQQITVQFDPSTFYARNLNGAFDSTISGNVRLTSKRVPWSDPPQGGGYAQGFGGDATPDNSYPFYYDASGEVVQHESGTPEANCTLPVATGVVLSMHDAPSDGCLPGGSDNGKANCKDQLLAPHATAEPMGSFGGYSTHLAGVNADGSATDLGIGFTWTSNNNGSTGGVSIKKTDLPADNKGTGGATITSVTETSNFGGISITGVNSSPPPTPTALKSGKSCNGAFTGTFHGNVTVSAGQNCSFTGGYVSGSVQVNGGSLALSGALIGGSVKIAGNCTKKGKSRSCTGGTFSIGPSTVVDGNLQVTSLPAGSAQDRICGTTVYGNLQVLGNASPIQIGASDPTSCLGNSVPGVSKKGGKKSGGSLMVENNTGATTVFGNAIGATLQCSSNSSITGGTDTAHKKTGQCSAF